LKPIPDEPDHDAAKDVVIDTCKSSLEMDIAEMLKSGLGRGFKGGFKVEEFERLSEPDPAMLQHYLVTLDCHYWIELAQKHVLEWLEELPDWPWQGHWTFVVHLIPQANAEWSFQVVRYSTGVWHIKNSDAKPKWPMVRSKAKVPWWPHGTMQHYADGRMVLDAVKL
jgi:hypothetical protein